jgi:hypothetical protein
MGGSGGYFESSPSDYIKLIKDMKEKTRDKAFETNVEKLINNILYDYNEREKSDSIKQHLDDIKDCIEEELGEPIELKFGGSFSKHTYIDGLSDIDMLVLINKKDLGNPTPKVILEAFKKSLINMRFKDIKDIRTGDIAATVVFSDGSELQLLPAFKIKEGYRIPSSKGNEWSSIINPDKFAKKLTEINQSCWGKVVPVIKLVKGVNSRLPEPQQLNGYHIESMAIEIFKSYPESNLRTSKTMLKYFYEKAKEIVMSPIKDETGQSRHVDEYLGKESSPARMRISRSLDIIFRRMRDADEIGDVSRWEQILDI